MNNKDYTFGANILENLTTGMYTDSKILYREYIQNSCDQIDLALKENLNKDEQLEIFIDIQPDNRYISIHDNATGLEQSKFRKTLETIADSEKKLGEFKGFRGIGRLCGLAYCKKLVFSSKVADEDTISILEYDAQKMRDLVTQNNLGNKKISAKEILNQITKFYTKKAENDNKHFFKVELFDINEENHDLLNIEKVIDYLSFTLPVEYSNTFPLRSKIYEYAQNNNHKIDEYNIYVNGEAIQKRYKTHYFLNKNKKDEIYDISFREIFNGNEKLGWLWIGVSNFYGALKKDIPMRGIRIRSGNIQIGNEETLREYFSEPRGNNYFIGELFIESKDLIPNAQRSYFNENPTRLIFENKLDEIGSELSQLYRKANQYNKDLDKIKDYEEKSIEFKTSESLTQAEEIRKKDNLKELKDIRDKSIKDIKNLFNNSKNSVVNKIIKDNLERRFNNEFKNEENKNEENIEINKTQVKKKKRKKSNKRSNTLDRQFSHLTKRERRIIERVIEIIYDTIKEPENKILTQKIFNMLNES